MNKVSAAAVSAALGAALVVTVSPEAHAAATLQQRALSTANAQKGDPYRWGATGPNAFDCSGLVLYSYGKAGKKLPRTAQQQYNASKKIYWKNRVPGDIVAFGTSSGNITHIGIYAGYWSGKSWIVNANTGSYRGRKVVVAPLSEYKTGGRKDYWGRF